MATAITWKHTQEGASDRWLGFAPDHSLVAQLVHYDMCGASKQSGWIGYVHGVQVTGRCVAPELAQRLVTERLGALDR